MKKLLVILILFATLISQGSAKLKCYQCTSTSSSNNDPCYDPRSSKDIKARTCSEDIVSKFIDLLKVAVSTEPLRPVCMKTEIKVGKETITRRDCAMVPKDNMKYQDKCKQFTLDTGGALYFCGICETDGCNFASGLQASSLLTYLLLSTTIFLFRLI